MSALSPKLLDPRWQLDLISNLINNGSLALVGALLIHLAIAFHPGSDRLRARYNTFRRWALAASIGFLLLIPLQMSASWKLYSSVVGQSQQLSLSISAPAPAPGAGLLTSADKQMPTKKAEELRCDRPRCQLTTKTQNSLERKADSNEERCNLVHGDDIRHTEEGAKGRAGMIDCQTADRHATCVTGCCAHLSMCTCKCAAEPGKQQSKTTSPPMPDKLRCAPHAESETAQDAKSAVSRWTICQNLQAVAAQPFQRATSDLHQTCQKCICDWRT